ncbi:MAG: imidazole glycerol phosphate synthase subunit HisH [Nonlabens sp.]
MIAIVKYNAGNIGSVTNALNRLGVPNKVTDDPLELKTADKVIFPGVGEAGTAMKYLRERGLDSLLKELTQPVLGICLGMQLMCNYSEEGDTECLGIFDTMVKRFPEVRLRESQDSKLKVPHMGWNSIVMSRNTNNTSTQDYTNQPGFPIQGKSVGFSKADKLIENLKPNNDVYYVHSYYAEICENTVASCNYILPFSSVLAKNNFYATQFHPEKSATVGEQIIKNFIDL